MGFDRSTILQNAQLFASRGQFDSAIAEWRKLTSESPTDGSVFNTIGDLHLKRNASSEAITAYLQAAAIFRAEGATLKAIAAYKKVLKVDPSRYEVYRHLGDLNAERGLLSSAVSDYLTLGKHYLKERKTREALEVYRKIATQDPANFDAQQRVAELCLQENLQDEAVTVYLQLGRERSAQQRHEEAKHAYQAVLRIDPSNSEAAQYVQMIEKGGGGTDPSRPVRSGAAPAAGPNKAADSVDMLGEATRRMEDGQYVGAEAILNQLLTREPGNPQVCQLLARLHLHKGELQVALNEYRFLAGAAMRAQDHPLAESLIAEYLKVDPACVALLELLGSLHEEKGDHATAALHYGRAVEVLLEHPEPGMPTLPAELYEKVKMLAPASPLVAKLTPMFGGTSSLPGAPHEGDGSEAKQDESGHIPTVPMEHGTSDVQETFTVKGAAPDDAWKATSKISRTQEQRFSIKDATPDEDWISAAKPHEQHEGDEALSTPEPVEENSANQLQETGLPISDQKDQEYETHYTLGMAYKNMGLLEEAIEEFQFSMQGADSFVDSSLMVGLCLKEQGQPRQAIVQLERLLTNGQCQGERTQMVRYELAGLYEVDGQVKQALNLLESIPGYQDVPSRLAKIRGDQQAATT
ncbi:MAG: tetratricopeptide repeat protein [Nitrospiraceae bacterium]